MIKIKHKLSGEVKDCSELEHFMMMDSDDWAVQEDIKKPKVKKKAKKAKKSKK